MIGEKEDSPGLERFRDARAEQEEIKLAEMKRTVVAKDWIHARLAEIAAIIRGVGDELQLECGSRALEILEAGLSEAEERIERMNNESVESPEMFRKKRQVS